MMKRLRPFLAVFCLVTASGFTANARASENVFRELGKDVKQTSKQVGRDAKKAGKQAGHAGKKVGKDIGKAGKNVGKSISNETHKLFKD